MQTWPDQLADLSTAQLSAFGETVTRADGSTLVGVVDLATAASAPWSEVGLEVRLGEQVNAMLIVADADAALLTHGDTLTVRAQAFEVVRVTPDRTAPGLSTVELMPAQTTTTEVWQ